MNKVTIRRIPDDEPDLPPVADEAGADAGVSSAVSSSSAPALVPSADLDPWSRLVLQVFGSSRGSKILSRRVCVFCQGRLRPYTDPKAGSAANKEFGVTPMLRCAKCGRTAS